MKKFLFLFVGIISMSSIHAQDITDAVRYSVGDIYGTARFRAMSGAFGAVGGDMTAISINPAGSAIFNTSYTTFSITNYGVDNTASYLNTSNSTNDSNFELNQAGIVFVFNNTNSDSPWGKIILAFSYEQTQNYNTNFFASGTNSVSIDSYFLANAKGLRLDEVSAFEGESITDAYGEIGYSFGYVNQQAFLGYESFILEPDTDEDANTVYTSNIAAGSFNQNYYYNSTGYNGKFSVNAAIEYKDKLYLGINLNSHYINYERSTFLLEENSNVGSLISEVGFENNLSTIGTGFSFQLGAIAKLSDEIRVGIAYDSPTWYTIEEETTQYLATVRNVDGSNITEILNPQIFNIFPKYKLQTPAKITGSIALILDKQAVISFDYSRKDYSSIKFKPESDPLFSVQNNLIRNSLKATNSYKIGGEYKLEYTSFRAGYKFEESPYNNTSFYGDLTGFSLGIGYNFGNTKVDLAYENAKRTIDYQLYSVGLTDAVRVNTKYSNITLSVSLGL